MNFELKGELKVELKLEVQPNENCNSIILMFKDLRTCLDNTCKCMGFFFFFSFHQNNTLPIRVPFVS
jgi:hypothetical protein